jgi:ABC-type maltose transport system permease subunit
MLVVVISIIFVVILIILFCKNNNSTEYYGQMKNIRRIPKNTCYNNCKQYYNQCMSQFQYIDAGSCSTRYWNCISTCENTDYHRV